jgi:hypothetical protein
MAISAHAQMLKSGHEDVEEFATAWQLSPARSRGESLPRNRTEQWHVCYQDFGCVGSKLEWLLKKIGNERLKVVVFDDLVNNTRATYLDVLNFLGVPDDGRTSFERKNRRRYHRYKFIANIVNRPPRHLVACSTLVKRILALDELGIIDRLRDWNLKVETRTLNRDLIVEMQRHYRPEVRKLENLLGRNLGWF